MLLEHPSGLQVDLSERGVDLGLALGLNRAISAAARTFVKEAIVKLKPLRERLGIMRVFFDDLIIEYRNGDRFRTICRWFGWGVVHVRRIPAGKRDEGEQN